MNYYKFSLFLLINSNLNYGMHTISTYFKCTYTPENRTIRLKEVFNKSLYYTFHDPLKNIFRDSQFLDNNENITIVTK